ncbi:hypothetical protein SAMN04488595_103170 [Ralstonia sp. 25mfcol4.1]|nr:hypothetical protein SAMN04488595_103170 [Ralstonia sp. 25mfcol4.1]
MSRAKTPVSRAPRGVLKDKPISMRLLSKEREQLEQLALVENRSLSSLARLILLEGLSAYECKPARTIPLRSNAR